MKQNLSFIWNARNRIVYLCWHGNIETNTLSIILEGDEECKNISSLNIECSSTTRTTNAYIFLSTDMCTITWQTVVQCVIFVWLKSKLEQNTHRSIEMVPFWSSCSASICGKNTVFFVSLSLSLLNCHWNWIYEGNLWPYSSQFLCEQLCFISRRYCEPREKRCHWAHHNELRSPFNHIHFVKYSNDRATNAHKESEGVCWTNIHLFHNHFMSIE